MERWVVEYHLKLSRCLSDGFHRSFKLMHGGVGEKCLTPTIINGICPPYKKHMYTDLKSAYRYIYVKIIEGHLKPHKSITCTRLKIYKIVRFDIKTCVF